MENISAFKYGMSDPALIEMIGDFIRQTRLSKNKTQQEIAAMAGVNRSTLVQLEKGKGGTLLTFIQVLRAMDLLHLLEVFAYEEVISPLMVAEMQMNERKRASKNKNGKQYPKSTW
jgi:transcriptional regulator with XRE-family HTH domain